MNRLTGLILGAMAILLSACAGFTPLYAEPGVVAGRERITVEVPNNRTGFLLREQLEDAFGRDPGQESTYRLTTRLAEQRVPLGRRADDTATRYELTLTVSYVLTEIRTNRLVHQDVITVSTTYAAAAQPYAGVVAGQDGSERAVAQASDMIRTDLARLFAEQAGAAAG